MTPNHHSEAKEIHAERVPGRFCTFPDSDFWILKLLTLSDHRGFFKSPAGLTVVAGVFVDEGPAFWAGVGVTGGRLEFSFVMTDSLKS